MSVCKLDNLELSVLIELEDILLCRHSDRRNEKSYKKCSRLDFHSNISAFDIYFLVRDKIKSVYIMRDCPVCSHNLHCLLKSSSETVMMIVPLEPVVTMIPVSQITQITDLYDSSSFFVAIFLHSLM
jgi:hypothetical protein